MKQTGNKNKSFLIIFKPPIIKNIVIHHNIQIIFVLPELCTVGEGEGLWGWCVHVCACRELGWGGGSEGVVGETAAAVVASDEGHVVGTGIVCCVRLF